jgi:hypothetical protein
MRIPYTIQLSVYLYTLHSRTGLYGPRMATPTVYLASRPTSLHSGVHTHHTTTPVTTTHRHSPLAAVRLPRQPDLPPHAEASAVQGSTPARRMRSR